MKVRAPLVALCCDTVLWQLCQRYKLVILRPLGGHRDQANVFVGFPTQLYSRCVT